MSWQASSWALREAPAATPYARLVLMALADRAHPDGSRCWARVEVLAAEAHCSRRTVISCLHSLEESGAISRGDQSLACYDERGRYLAPQHRPIVWNLNMGVTLESLEEDPDVHEGPDGFDRPDAGSRGAKVARLENGGIPTVSRGAEIAPRNPRGANDCTSRGANCCTSNKEEQNINITTPLGSPQQGDADQGEGDDGCSEGLAEKAGRVGEVLAAAGVVLPAGWPDRRELRCLRALLGSYGLDTVLAVTGWAVGRSYWLPRVSSLRGLARVFEQARLEMISQRNPGPAGTVGSRPAHRHSWACEHTLAAVGASCQDDVCADGGLFARAVRAARLLNEGRDPDSVCGLLDAAQDEGRGSPASPAGLAAVPGSGCGGSPAAPAGASGGGFRSRFSRFR
ncbi:conserved hypothetical protein [Parascardovia denticolens DSM 10105 = JCM 12538]|nr:hypothetical protein HMPREF9017_01062 [Parascardovia denticolens F0305]BAR04650.1 conserved hypothetical protein [Parascardovia denticolens DSM 10105 = JCM 12538]